METRPFGTLFLILGLPGLLAGCARSPAQAAGAEVPALWPVAERQSVVTSPFGMRRHPNTGEYKMHKGIDIAAPMGTPVVATAGGVVRFSGKERLYGQMVVVDHGGGIETAYGHLKKRKVGVGDRVRRGGVVGILGRSGNATGPHLQYEVRVDGRPVNPAPYLP